MILARIMALVGLFALLGGVVGALVGDTPRSTLLLAQAGAYLALACYLRLTAGGA